MLNKRIVSLMLLSAIISTSVACGGSGDPVDTTAPDVSESVETTEKPEYVFPELDCNGEAYTILHCEPTKWNMHAAIDIEVQTGDALDDAMFSRNRYVEELYNCKIELELQNDSKKTAERIRTMVMAGEDELNLAYCQGDHIASLISDGLIADLNTIPEIRLSEPWWNQNVRQSAMIGNNNSVFYATSDFSLTSFDLTWCIYFNESLINEYALEMPYDLVRNGKWTFDKFAEYAKSAANLNGDESFTFKNEGNSVYGVATYNNFVGACMAGAGITHTKPDSSGTPALAIENDRFYTFAEKYAKLFATPGEAIDANSTDAHYERIFKAGRALFVGGEVKASNSYRDMDDDFGILPIPKLDEEQESYHSFINYLTPLMTIPATCEDTERSGIVVDTLSYLSTKDILPIYYNVTISQKELRSEDSIDMLNIIRDSRVFESSLAYGWTINLYQDSKNSIRAKLHSGESDVSSIIASSKETVANRIKATLELVNG